MSTARIDLALKKQRLQFRSSALRNELAGHATFFTPLFAAGDKVREGARWLQRNPEVMVAAGVALVVARPRNVFRWARRGVVAWQAWGRLNAWIDTRRGTQ